MVPNRRDRTSKHAQATRKKLPSSQTSVTWPTLLSSIQRSKKTVQTLTSMNRHVKVYRVSKSNLMHLQFWLELDLIPEAAALKQPSQRLVVIEMLRARSLAKVRAKAVTMVHLDSRKVPERDLSLAKRIRSIVHHREPTLNNHLKLPILIRNRRQEVQKRVRLSLTKRRSLMSSQSSPSQRRVVFQRITRLRSTKTRI